MRKHLFLFHHFCFLSLLISLLVFQAPLVAPEINDWDDVRFSPRLARLENIDTRTTTKWVIYHVPPDLLPLIKLFHPVRTSHIREIVSVFIILIALFKDPPLWYLAQMIAYLLRINNDTTRFIMNTRERLNITRPLIGIHVRRTDKLALEAGYHSLTQYESEANKLFTSRSHLISAKEQQEEGRLFKVCIDHLCSF